MITLIQPVLADISNPVVPATQATGPEFTNNALQLIFSLFLIVGVLYFAWHLVFAGYHLIGSQGDPKAFETAKNELTYSFIGLVVVFSVFAILRVIGTVFSVPGLESLQISLPTL